MTIERARKLLGKRSELYTDEQVQDVLNMLIKVADIAIDSAIQRTSKKTDAFQKGE